MAAIAVVTVAWLPVYAILGIFFVALYLKRRSEIGYLLFGLTCFGVGAYAAGRTIVLCAADVHAAALGQQVEWLGVLPASATVLHLCQVTAEQVERRVLRAAYAVAAIGWTACLAGLFFDPARGVEERTAILTLIDLERGPEADTTFVGWIFIGTSAATLAYAIVVTWRGVRAGLVAIRPLALALSALGLAAVHDLLVNAGILRSVFVLEHMAIVVVIAVCFSILREFVRIGDELEARTAELHRSVHELRATQEELVTKEQLAAVGELSAVIAHEVRNPLAVIANAVAGLRRTPLDDRDRVTLLAILEEEAGRLNRLVGDLLQYARPIAPQHRRVPVREVLGRAIELARGTNQGSAQVEVRLSLGGPEVVVGDEDLLRRAFTNLVENAFQAMPQVGELSITSRTSLLDERIAAMELTFRDTGEGMDTLVRSKATNPFFTTRPTGTGLGLAIVSRIVRAHGGLMTIDSRHGEGTAIALLLPCEPRPDSAPPPPEPPLLLAR